MLKVHSKIARTEDMPGENKQIVLNEWLMPIFLNLISLSLHPLGGLNTDMMVGVGAVILDHEVTLRM